MRVTQFLAPVVALVGLEKVMTGKRVLGAILLFGAAAVGLIASILARYYNSRQDDAARSQRIALETLARLGDSRERHK
jgi:hypothetical protein